MADANTPRPARPTHAKRGPRDHATLTPGLQRNQSLKRAVQILRGLAESSDAATTSELAVAVGLPRPTVARMLATLADAGLAERLDDGGRWVLGYEATRLGRAADPYAVLLRRARPHLAVRRRELLSLLAHTRALRPPLPRIYTAFTTRIIPASRGATHPTPTQGRNRISDECARG